MPCVSLENIVIVFKGELKQGQRFSWAESGLSPHRYHRGQRECFDDFGIAQEYLKTIWFSAGPLTEAQGLSIQATASCYCCLYSPRSDWIFASNHKKKKRQWGAGEEREGDVHEHHLQLVWLLALSLWKPLELLTFQSYALLFPSLTSALGLYLNKKKAAWNLWISVFFSAVWSCRLSIHKCCSILPPAREVNGSHSRDLLISSEFTASTALQLPASRCAFSVALLRFHKLIRFLFFSPLWFYSRRVSCSEIPFPISLYLIPNMK